MNYPKSIQNAIEAFRHLPGVGAKTAERYVLALLDYPTSVQQQIFNDLFALQTVKQCHICGNYCDGEVCDICDDEARDPSTLCVVASPKDLLAIENAGFFNGRYHVLNGVLSSSKGIYPDDLNLQTLFDRIQNGKINEVVLATPLTMDGEMTAMYIDRKLKDTSVLVTRIARGLPMGGQIDYADMTTLRQAFNGRKKVSENE